MSNAALDACLMPSGQSLRVAAFDASGNPTNITAVSNGDDVQTISLTGIPAGAGQTVSLNYNGQATAPIAAVAAGPIGSGFGLWTVPVTPGSGVTLAVSIVGGTNNSTNCRYDIIDNGVVVLTAYVNQATGSADRTGVVDGITVSLKILNPAALVVPSGSSLQVLVTDQTASGKYVASLSQAEDLSFGDFSSGNY